MKNSIVTCVTRAQGQRAHNPQTILPWPVPRPPSLVEQLGPERRVLLVAGSLHGTITCKNLQNVRAQAPQAGSGTCAKQSATALRTQEFSGTPTSRVVSSSGAGTRRGTRASPVQTLI